MPSASRHAGPHMQAAGLCCSSTSGRVEPGVGPRLRRPPNGAPEPCPCPSLAQPTAVPAKRAHAERPSPHTAELYGLRCAQIDQSTAAAATAVAAAPSQPPSQPRRRSRRCSCRRRSWLVAATVAEPSPQPACSNRLRSRVVAAAAVGVAAATGRSRAPASQLPLSQLPLQPQQSRFSRRRRRRRRCSRRRSCRAECMCIVHVQYMSCIPCSVCESRLSSPAFWSSCESVSVPG